MKSNCCIICHSQSSTPLYPAIVRCDRCDYTFADLNLSREEFEELYNSGYFKGEEYSDYVSDKDIIQKNFSDRFKVLKKYINPNKHSKLLEVGCAYGFFLELAKPHFSEVTGVDITSDGVSFAQTQLGVDAIKVDLLDWDWKLQKYDVVCMWDTIEHLPRPDLFIEKISENINEDGLIAITTGDIESFVAKFRKNKWRLIHPPTHAHYFSKKSLSKLLENNGFEVIHFEHCGFSRSLDNIFYNILVLRMNCSWLYNLLKKTGILKLNLYLNLFDIMFIIAKKKISDKV